MGHSQIEKEVVLGQISRFCTLRGNSANTAKTHCKTRSGIDRTRHFVMGVRRQGSPKPRRAAAKVPSATPSPEFQPGDLHIWGVFGCCTGHVMSRIQFGVEAMVYRQDRPMCCTGKTGQCVVEAMVYRPCHVMYPSRRLGHDCVPFHPQKHVFPNRDPIVA